MNFYQVLGENNCPSCGGQPSSVISQIYKGTSFCQKVIGLGLSVALVIVNKYVKCHNTSLNSEEVLDMAENSIIIEKFIKYLKIPYTVANCLLPTTNVLLSTR